ncbi:hypothetical protein D3C73_1091030 [compost metagenome]
MVDGAFSEYIDQCNGAMWLLGRKWVELGGWGPFKALYLQTILARQEGLEPPNPGLEGPCEMLLTH